MQDFPMCLYIFKQCVPEPLQQKYLCVWGQIVHMWNSNVFFVVLNL